MVKTRGIAKCSTCLVEIPEEELQNGEWLAIQFCSQECKDNHKGD